MPTQSGERIRKGTERTGATQAIIAELRGQIVRGEYSPGERIPPRSELMEHFGTTKVTVQRAIETLVGDGFISTDGWRGTYVSQHPPHLARYALVTNEGFSPDSVVKFWTSLRDSAAVIERGGVYKFPVFYNVNMHYDSEDAARLLREITTNQIAGVIFTFNPEWIENTPLMQAARVPLVAIMDQANSMGVPAVKIDYESYFDKALDYLAQRGYRRIAALNPPHLAIFHREYFFNGLAARGLHSKPFWWCPANLEFPQFAAVYAQLLLNEAQSERPDALIISDDNLVGPVIKQLQAEGMRVPGDIEIVAHSNFATEASLPATMPVQRIGFSSRQILGACVDLIDLQRAKGKAPPLSVVKATSDEEV